MSYEDFKAKHAEYMRKYKRRKRGLPEDAVLHPGKPANTPEVLWSKVDVRGADECWPWKGLRNGEGGYGRVQIESRSYYAHRVIFNLANPGKIELSAPSDRNGFGFLLHSCDNPICCNPGHLRIGTHAENMQDKIDKGRQHTFESVHSPRAKLTADDVRFIRSNHTSGGGTMNKPQLMEKFSVSLPTIKSVLSGRTYSDVK
jgi:hypothetical protein